MYTSFVRDGDKRCFLTFRRIQKEALKSGREQVVNLGRSDLVNDVCVEWGYGIGLSDMIFIIPDGVRLSVDALYELRVFSHDINQSTPAK